MSMLETIVPQTPQTADRKYKSMIRAVGAGRRHEVDPAIVETSGRFTADAEADADVSRKRHQSVLDVEQGIATMAELEANPPAPRPTLQTPISDFKTIGEIIAAIHLVENPHSVVTTEKLLWTEKYQAARKRVRQAKVYLQRTADKSLDEKGNGTLNEISRLQQVGANRANLIERRANLKKRLDAGDGDLGLRREFATLGKRIGALPESTDSDVIARLQADVERTEQSKLDPANQEFAGATTPRRKTSIDPYTPRG